MDHDHVAAKSDWAGMTAFSIFCFGYVIYYSYTKRPPDELNLIVKLVLFVSVTQSIVGFYLRRRSLRELKEKQNARLADFGQ